MILCIVFLWLFAVAVTFAAFHSTLKNNRP